MSKVLIIYLIEFYQRVISPIKGFHCAHHQLHKADTCSNAVKQLIFEYGFITALPKIRLRFKQCRLAYKTLSMHQADLSLPCDASCDLGVGECLGSSAASSDSCNAPCELLTLIFSSTRSLVGILTVSLILGYWFYGRGVSTIQLNQLSAHSSGLIERLSQREEPSIRVVMEVDGQKYYSSIAKLTVSEKELILNFDIAPLSFEIDSVKILDARINIGNERIVVGQILEEYNNPSANEKGDRFQIELHRRWHFF